MSTNNILSTAEMMQIMSRIQRLFRAINLPDELKNEDVVKAMLELVNGNHLQTFELGRVKIGGKNNKKKLSHIASHIICANGKEDYLMSPIANDNNYKSLVEAHMQRVFEIMNQA